MWAKPWQKRPWQPDNFEGIEAAVAVDFNGPKDLIGFVDVSVLENYQVLCEVRILTMKCILNF